MTDFILVAMTDFIQRTQGCVRCIKLRGTIGLYVRSKCY